MSKFSKFLNAFILCGLFFAAFAIRIYDLQDPPLDFHAARQLRSAIIARSFYVQFTESANSQEAQAAANLADLESYEPPIMEAVTGAINALLGKDTFTTGRIFSSLFWVIGGIFIYLIGIKQAPRSAVLISLLFYFFLPFSVIAGRSFQPDPWMCAWIVITAYGLMRWAEERSVRWMICAALCGSFAVLIKVFAVFFVGSMLIGIYLCNVRYKDFWRLTLQAFLIGLIMLIPSVILFLWINPERSGDFFSFWVVSLSGMIFTSKFYATWLAMIKGLTGLTLPFIAFFGVFFAQKPFRGILAGWWAGYLLYGLTFPYQISTHEYYSLILIPLISVSLLPIIAIVCKASVSLSFWRKITMVSLIAAFAGYNAFVAMGILRANDYANEPVSWRKTAEQIPLDAKFAALTTDYGMRLNYFGMRVPNVSWPSVRDYQLFALAGREQEDFEAYFAVHTENLDYFLVTVLNELENQPQLKRKLTQYPLVFDGLGILLYKLK